jgi:hypothetical protein
VRPGAKALGFEHGQLVERSPYDLLFGQRKARDGTPLGKPPGGGRKAQDHYPLLRSVNRSAEPEPVTSEQGEKLTMTAGEETREAWQRVKDLPATHRTFADWLADRLSLAISSQDPDYGDLGQAFPLARTRPRRDLAVAQAGNPAVPADPPARGRP